MPKLKLKKGEAYPTILDPHDYYIKPVEMRVIGFSSYEEFDQYMRNQK